MPSIKHVFPPLLPPPEALPLLAPTPTRRTPRLLVAGVVTTVLAVFAGLAVLVVLIAQPEPRRSEHPRPAVRRAEPGASGLVVDTPELRRVLEETPTDGRLHGLTRHVDVVSYGYTDRVRLDRPGRPHGETLAAADGEHWLVVELDSEDQPALTSGALAGVAPSRLSVVVDGDSTPVPLDRSGMAAFSVPLDAEAVHLVVTDHGLMQKWSFVTERRSEATPAIIYRARESRVAIVNGSWSLPYGATSPADPPPPPPGSGATVPATGRSTGFGDRSLTLEVAEARLTYALGVVPSGGGSGGGGDQGGDGVAFHTASGADRGLLYLSGVRVDWGGGDPTAHAGYSVRPEDMVLSMPDGTTVGATPVVDDPASVVYDLDEGEPVELGISAGALVWDVPADIQRATLTIRPSPATVPPTGDRIDFRGGSIQFEIVFTGA